MIKIRDWDRLYVHIFDWVLRRLEPDCLQIYHDTEQDWIEAIKAFNKVQLELFDKYAVTYRSGNRFKGTCIKGLDLTADQLFELFHKHLKKYTNYTVRYFIFRWWNDLRYYVSGAQPALDCAAEFFKKATGEEVKQANKDFGIYSYKDTVKIGLTFNRGQVLEYRGIRFPVDDQWGDAWFKAKTGDIKHFQLEHDWWYSIDEFLDLYNS